MYKRIKVRKHELALWFREGELHKVLKAGVYRLSSLVWFPGRNSIQKVDLTKPRFEHPMLQVLVKDVRLAKRLAVVDLAEDERALVWVRGRLADILEPGVHAYWIDLVDVEIERFDVNSLWFEHAKREAILNFPGSSRYFNGIRVDANERVIVYRDGELDRQLDAGHFIYWRSGANVTWKSVDLREQSADIQGQEIMTADKVTLRMNLLVTYRVIDPLKAVTEVPDWAQALYREAQLELRAAVGGRALEKLLTDKDEVGREIRNRLAPRAEGFGLALSSVGLRDIILPGDMKVILNEVILAQKQAEANLIRRREETAAARSQANTAKLLAENPVLARMKELEALQEILKGSRTTFVLGQGDLTEQVTSLIRQQADEL